MAIPSTKAPLVEEFLEAVFERTSSIKADCCVPQPVGCGGRATEFDSELSAREYTVSGLCQRCQDEIFGSSASDDGEVEELDLDAILNHQTESK